MHTRAACSSSLFSRGVVAFSSRLRAEALEQARHARDQARHQREALDNMLEFMAEPLAFVADDGLVHRVNPALINLVGRSVNCIKTPDHCDEILRSRVESTRVLGEACRAVASPPPVWVQMSTAHIYGDPPTAVW